MNKDKPIIEVRDLTVRYGRRTILENVTFDIYPGEIFLIVGGSGCGKSTMLRQIIGLEKPTSGSIIIDEENFSGAKPKQHKNILKKFGVLFQSSGLVASMTLAENISLVLETEKNIIPDLRNEIISLKLKAVGLGGFEEYLPSEISGGMKKRAALARAMALDPKILCFDEPTSGLDPITSASMDKLVVELNSALNSTMVIVSHDLASIMSIATRVIMLDSSCRGIIAQGTPQELALDKSNPLVYSFFNRLV